MASATSHWTRQLFQNIEEQNVKNGLEPSTEEHSKPLNFSCNVMRDETVPQEWQFPSKFCFKMAR